MCRTPGDKQVIGCFMARQQLKLTSASTRCGQFTIMLRTYKDLLADRKTKSEITVTHNTCDTAYTSSGAYVSQPYRRETQQYAVSMHDLRRVYFQINTTTTLLLFS